MIREKELMLSGKLYKANDYELKTMFLKSKKLTREINLTLENEIEKRKSLFKELLGKVGDNFYIEPPFRCDYGCNIEIGNNFYANYDCIIIDINKVIIGNNVMIGPRTGIYTAGHPIDAEIRNLGLEFGKPIIIGNNVWIGGNVVILPEVRIGDNVVIGAGSVVTKDIPSNVVAVGNPCKVLRKINDNDKKIWLEKAKEYKENKQ